MTNYYKQYLTASLSQYSAQLAGIAFSSILTISTGFFNNLTVNILGKITGTAYSNENIIYLNNLSSSFNIWSNLNGDGISKVQPDSSKNCWTNFYISFSHVPQAISNFDVANLPVAGQAWYNSNLGSIKMMLSIFASPFSSLPYSGFFCSNGSNYYLMLPDGLDYGWISFDPQTTYLPKAGGNTDLTLVAKENGYQILESSNVIMISNGNYSQQNTNNIYNLNFAPSVDGNTATSSNLVSFSYYNQFLGLTMTLYSASEANSSIISFKDANGKGINIQKNKNISFVTN